MGFSPLQTADNVPALLLHDKCVLLMVTASTEGGNVRVDTVQRTFHARQGKMLVCRQVSRQHMAQF